MHNISDVSIELHPESLAQLVSSFTSQGLSESQITHEIEDLKSRLLVIGIAKIESGEFDEWQGEIDPAEITFHWKNIIMDSQGLYLTIESVKKVSAQSFANFISKGLYEWVEKDNKGDFSALETDDGSNYVLYLISEYEEGNRVKV